MKTIVVLLSIVVAISAADLPSGFKTCKLSDPHFNKCYVEAGKIALKILAKGDDALGILPLDPLVIGDLIVKRNGPMTITQEYHNMVVYGLTKNLQVKVKSFTALSVYKEAYYPYFYLLSDYKMNGRGLLPVQGEGKCRLTMRNSTFTLNDTYETYEKNGETYLKYKKFDFHIKDAKLEMQFENLFDGSPKLGEEINKIINENSEEIFSEVKPAFEKVFKDTIFTINNKIFSQVPLRKIFPE